MPSLLQPADPLPLPASLAAFLLCHVAVSAREEDILRQALRDAAVSLPDREAHRVARTLHNYISPEGQAMLRRLA